LLSLQKKCVGPNGKQLKKHIKEHLQNLYHKKEVIDGELLVIKLEFGRSLDMSLEKDYCEVDDTPN
jgi:hypothetical protein